MINKHFIFLVPFFALIGCEEDPDMAVGSPSFPVVYAIFDKYCELNEVYVTRSFSGIDGPLTTAQNFDSVFFSDVSVWASFQGPEGRFDTTFTEIVRNNRQPGDLIYPQYKVLSLKRNIEEFEYCSLKVFISGFDTLRFSTNLLTKPDFLYPKLAGTYVTMLPDQPFYATWGGNLWNDARVSIKICSFYNNRIDTTIMNYQRIGINNDFSGKYSIRLGYDRFKNLCEQNLIEDSGLQYRVIDNISVEISIGNGRFKSYMEQLLIEQDYMTFFESTEGIIKGIVTSKATNTLQGILLSYRTKEFINADKSLSQFKFSKW